MRTLSTFPPRTNSIFKAVLFCGVFLLLFILFSFIRSFFLPQHSNLIHGITGMLVAALTLLLFLKMDHRTFSGIGLRFQSGTLRRFFTGVLIGLGLMGLLTFSVIYFSSFTIASNPNSGFFYFLWVSLPLLPMAFMEEAGFRSFPLVVLREKNGIRLSILITSLLFALYHLANGWSVQNSFLGAGVWGIIFGLAAVASNGIAMSTGLHYAVNLLTSAFGISANSPALWILQQKDGSSLENYQSSLWETLLPQLCLLVFGVGIMEWYFRKKKLDNR